MLKSFFSFSKTPPEFVESSERLVRFVLSPMHFRGGELRSTAFSPTNDTNEISVTRLEHSTPTKCKHLAVNMNCSSTYCGFCVLTKQEALDSGSTDVLTSPSKNNKAHANIIVPYKKVRGQSISPQLQFILDEMLSKARYYEDPALAEKEWTGSELK